MTARSMLRALACGLVALAVIAIPVLADELFGSVKSVDPEGKKIVVTEKDTDKDVDVKITDETEYVATKKGETTTTKLDAAALEKMKTRVEAAKEKNFKINVKVTHEKGVASKIEQQKGAAKKKDN